MTNAEARFNKIHIRKVYACLAVTCHLHFWQNDRDFLRATVVTRGWNGYRNKSQHRKSTLEKKILPPFQQGFEPATFQSRVRCSNHWAIPAPRNSRFSFHCYIQREATPSQKSARKWRCDLSRETEMTKGIHSCKPASLNHPTVSLPASTLKAPADTFSACCWVILVFS